jgi:hypothetical protein
MIELPRSPSPNPSPVRGRGAWTVSDYAGAIFLVLSFSGGVGAMHCAPDME